MGLRATYSVISYFHLNTSFKPLQILAKPTVGNKRYAQKYPEAGEFVQDSLSPETLAMLIDYCFDLQHIVRFHKENDGVGSTAVPSFDLAMRYALGVVRKALRVDVKKARGEWALRKLKLQAQ